MRTLRGIWCTIVLCGALYAGIQPAEPLTQSGFHICRYGVVMGTGGGPWYVVDDNHMPDVQPISLHSGTARVSVRMIPGTPRRFVSMAYGDERAVLTLVPGRSYLLQTPDLTHRFDAVPLQLVVNPRDVNMDGRVNSTDRIQLLNWIRADDWRGDWNADGTVDDQDFTSYLGSPP